MGQYTINSTLEITKKGRKWLHCTDTTTKRRYKVLVDDKLKDVAVGDTLTGRFDVTDKSDGFGVNREATFTKEDIADSLIQRLSDVVDQYGRLSKTTLGRLDELNLTEDQAARVKAIKEKVKIKTRDSDIKKRLKRLSSCVRNGYWSRTQEERLKALADDAGGEIAARIEAEVEDLRHQLEQQKEKTKITKANEKAQEEQDTIGFTVYHPYHNVGDVVEHKGVIGKVVKVTKAYIEAEMAFSVGLIGLPDGGYYWNVVIDPNAVTATEKAEKQAEIEAAKATRELKARRATLKKEIEREISTKALDGELRKTRLSEIAGERLYSTFDIYGGGFMLLSVPGKCHWMICNNGRDGDNWGMNNIGGTGGAGAFGSYFPGDPSETLLQKIKEFDDLTKRLDAGHRKDERVIEDDGMER